MKEICTDFQGWPEYAQTLREVLLSLGFEEDDKTITLVKSEETNKLLDAYPRILHDDGMGYGIHQGFVTVVDDNVYEYGENKPNSVMKGVNVFNIFGEIEEKGIDGVDETLC
jgi:hypothetical protein